MPSLRFLLPLAVAGALCAHSEARAAPTAPSVADVLVADDTVFAVGVQSLVDSSSWFMRIVEALPEFARAEMPPEIRSRKALSAKLGFDPTTAGGWKKIGIDPTAGFAVAVDRKVGAGKKPVPLIVGRVTDRGALTALLRKHGVEIDVPKGANRGTIDGDTVFIGDKSGWLVVAPGPDEHPEGIEPAFRQWVARTSKPLSGSKRLAPAVRVVDGSPWYFAFADTKAMIEMVGENSPESAWAAERFPAFGGGMSATDGRYRAMLDDTAREALKKIFVPTKKSPDFARLMPPDQGYIKVNLNLPHLVDGIGALLPPSMQGLMVQMRAGEYGLPAAIGLTRDQLYGAFSGHFAAAFRPVPDRPIPTEVLFAAGIGDPKLADIVITKVVEQLRLNAPELTIEPAEIGGHAGHRGRGPQANFVIVRAGDVLVVGLDEAAVATGLARRKGDPALKKFFNGAYVVGMSTSAKATVNSGIPPEVEAVWTAVVGPNADGRLSLGLRLQDNTVDFGGGGESNSATVMLVGVLAAVAIPAFMKYIRRSKTAEATFNLRKLFDSSVSFYGEEHSDRTGKVLPRRFPKSAPQTPGSPTKYMCRDGKSVKFQPTAETWDDPAWQELDFAIDEPFLYAYTFEAEGDGDGAIFTARANGDLNCDGTQSTFERTGRIDAEGNVTGGAGIYTNQELE